MNLVRTALGVIDLPLRVARKLRGTNADYRAFLFDDLLAALGATKPNRIIEIGPRDGEDTRRLVTLGAKELVLVDLPNQKERISKWLPQLGNAPIEVVYGNVMYDRAFDSIAPFDIVWCTGVLYHNPEQLRFVRQLFDLTAPEGLLVLETATARRRHMRNENCVEIWFPPNKASSRSCHLSENVTHLPSVRAVQSWLGMFGFVDVIRSSCHRRVTRSLAADRAAFIARRPINPDAASYYRHVSHEFPLGRTR